MPVESCGNGRWRIGDGECVYTSEAAAERAYVAYLAQENENENDKSMIYNYKHQSLEVKDIDQKQGIVTGYFSAFDYK